MDILNVLIRLRDDIKIWVSNNVSVLNTKIENKIDKVEGKGLSTNDFTNDYKNKLDNFNESGENQFEETDPTVPAWAKHPNKPTYTASEVGALPADTVIPSIDGLATEIYVDTKVAALINSAPEALNTLDELAAALGDDENFATTVTNQIASKLDASELSTAITETLAQAKTSGEFDGKDGVDGKDGINGVDGVGISSIVQTTTSTVDNENNIITVTLSNGNTSTFTIKNGSKGSTGDKGDAGKTPVRGTDYWTDADKAEIKTYVDETIYTGVSASHIIRNVYVPVPGWVDNEQTVTVEGVLADSTACTIIVGPDWSSSDESDLCGVCCSGQGDNTLTFQCINVPTEDIVMNATILI